MGGMGVIDLKIVTQTGFKVLGRTEIASFQKTTGQDTKPQLNLVEPGTMFGRKVEHMLMARITQERPPLHTSTQGLGNKGHLAPPSDQPADIEAPVGVEIINDPVVASHIWDRRAHLNKKVRFRACAALLTSFLIDRTSFSVTFQYS
jgi:hypothetical protein